MRCPHCHTANQPYAAFCLGCGEGLAAGPPAAAAPERPSAGDRAAAAGRLPWLGRLPALRRRPGPVLAGLVVVALLLAVAGDVLAQQSRVDHYRAGRVAEDQSRWATAAQAYGEAVPYRDAATRAQLAISRAAAVAKWVTQATAAAAGGDWLAAQQALAEAVRLAPADRTLADRAAAARQEAARQGAAGLVFRRSGASGPGLYLQGPLDQPPAFLPGSDGASQVAAFSAAGAAEDVVFDGPALAGGSRLLLLGHLVPGTTTVAAVRELPGTLPLDGWGQFCPGGLWWFNSVAPTLTYYDLRSSTARAVLPAGGLELLSAGVAQGHLLLAQPPPDGGTGTRLYLAAADGGAPRAVLESQGRIASAEESPDGQWVAYALEQPGAMTLYRHAGDFGWTGTQWAANRPDARTLSLMLHPLGPAGPSPGVIGTAAEPDQLLDLLVLPDDAPAGGGSLVAHWVPGLPATLVANHNDRIGRRVAVYTAATGLQTTYWPDPAPTEGLDGPYFSPGGNFLLLEEGGPAGVRLATQPMTGAPGQPARVLPVAAPAGSLVLGQVALRDDYLLYLVNHTGRGRAHEEYGLYSVPLAADSASAAPVELFHAIYNPSLFHQPNITLAPNGSLVAYIRPDGILLGLPLDGAPPVELARDVQDVWSPRP